MNQHRHADKWSRSEAWRIRGRLLVACLLVVLVAPLGALSHPYDPGYYSLRSALRVDASRGLQLMAVAEVPNTDMLQAFVDRFGFRDEYAQEEIDAFIAKYFDVFAEGLSVEMGGRPLAGRWEPVDDPRNGRVGEQGLFIFMLSFVVDEALPESAERLEIEIRIEAFAGEDAYFSGSVEALEPWRVAESSVRELLGEVSGAADVNECFECWSRDESLRRSRALFLKGNPSPPAENAAGDVTQP